MIEMLELRKLTVSRELFQFECDFYNNQVFLLSRHSHGVNLIQAVENSLGALRRAQDERRVFDIIDDFRSAEALEAFRIFFRQPIYGRYSDQVPEVALRWIFSDQGCPQLVLIKSLYLLKSDRARC